MKLMEDGTDLGDLAAGFQSCRHFGYETDQGAQNRYISRRIRDAIGEGIDGQTADNLIGDAITRRGRDLAIAMQTTDPQELAHELGRWRARCQILSEDYPEAVIANGDEDQVTEAFLRRLGLHE